MVAVFRYTGVNKKREDYEESGTVVARDKVEAIQKLRSLELDDIRLKKLGGIRSFIKALTADVK